MKEKLWAIKRYVIQEMEVTARTRVEALELAEDPHTVTITKETCVENKE
jgi:hypothetical protein